MTLKYYYDANSTAPLAEVAKQWLAEHEADAFGNPNSLHTHGVKARTLLEKARRLVAKAIDAETPETITFTSGATESINAVVASFAKQSPHGVIRYGAGDHQAVIEASRAFSGALTTQTFPINNEGRPSPPPAEEATATLTHLLAANNEIGSLASFNALAEQKQERELYHYDAAQALGRIPISVQRWRADFLSATFHKIGGPKGAGFLYVRPGIRFHELIAGGGQEAGRRSGTENVAACGAAAALLQDWITHQTERAGRLANLRDRLREQLTETILGVEFFSPRSDVLPNTLSVRIPGVPARILADWLNREWGFAVSPGSACSTNRQRPSHVILALGAGEQAAQETIRISLGPWNSADSVDALASALHTAATTLRIPR